MQDLYELPLRTRHEIVCKGYPNEEVCVDVLVAEVLEGGATCCLHFDSFRG